MTTLSGTGNASEPVTIGGGAPKRGDPRIKLFAIIVAIQTVGQVGLNFKISVAQILVTMGTCLVLELGVFSFRDGIIAWPASALQTGNSI